MRWSFGVLRDHHHLHISGKKSGWCGGPGPEGPPPPSVSHWGLQNDAFPSKFLKIYIAKYKGNTKEKLRLFEQNAKEMPREN